MTAFFSVCPFFSHPLSLPLLLSFCNCYWKNNWHNNYYESRNNITSTSWGYLSVCVSVRTFVCFCHAVITNGKKKAGYILHIHAFLTKPNICYNSFVAVVGSFLFLFFLSPSAMGFPPWDLGLSVCVTYRMKIKLKIEAIFIYFPLCGCIASKVQRPDSNGSRRWKLQSKAKKTELSRGDNHLFVY